MSGDITDVGKFMYHMIQFLEEKGLDEDFEEYLTKHWDDET